jgi:hypothetical protein
MQNDIIIKGLLNEVADIKNPITAVCEVVGEEKVAVVV